MTRGEYLVGVSLVVSKIEEGLRRLALLAGEDPDASLVEISPRIDELATRASERMFAARKRGR